jgi:serine protease Do
MEKFNYRGMSMAAFFLIVGQLSMAQAPIPPTPPSAPAPKADVTEKADKTEIVIKQNGDKDAKFTVEIKNGDVFIDGKPLDKFSDENVIIEKQKQDDDMVRVYGLSPFREDGMNYDRNEEMIARNMENLDRQKIMMDRQKNRMDRSVQIRISSAFLGISSKKAEKGGATVLEVTKGSPAEKSGIKKGDIITKVNNTKIESPESLYETVHSLKPGDTVKIIFLRDGKVKGVSATLDKSDQMTKNFNYNYNYKFKMPPMPDMNNMEFDENWGAFRQPKLGIKAQDAEDGKGVNVLDVVDSSAAAKAGLKKGDIILQVGGSDVNNTSELLDEFQEARQKSPIIKFKIMRGGISQDIEVKIPRKLKTAEL